MKKSFSFRDVSIKQKLIYLSMFITVLALLASSTVFFILEYNTMKRSLVQEMSAVAGTIGRINSAALIFGDRREARETLNALSSMQNIIYAALYDRNGELYTEYRNDNLQEDFVPVHQDKEGHLFSFTRLTIVHKIIFQKESIGKIVLVSNLRNLYVTIVYYVLLVTAIMACVLSGSYVLSSRLQKMVTEPLVAMAEVMGDISQNQNYSRRVNTDAGKDEIGYLARGFNEMLEAIQKRDEELDTYRRHLEELVEKRTSELVDVNKRLQKELAERLRTEQSLRESENMYRTIFENTGNASIIIEEDTTISLANSWFQRLSGYSLEDVVNRKSWTEFIDKEYLEKMQEYHYLRRVNPEAAPSNYESVFVDRAGNKKNVFLTVAMIPGTRKSIASILDITELKRLEENLQQALKMEAVGKLAGGIAHDFNNILTAIIGYGGMLQMKMADEDPYRMYVESILKAAERAASLTQGLLAFSRKQIIAPKAVQINSIVRDVEKLLRRLIGEDIELVTRLSDEDHTILADSGQIVQVLMNLATNARDAMPAGGKLIIETGISVLDELFIKTHNYGKPGRYVRMSISDNGIGMKKEVVDRIFEPFFTTKEVGKGTGLGLSIVYGIIKQHNGYIDVESVLYRGTTFTIYLPLSHTVQEEEGRQSVPEMRGGQETILVCEDDTVVRTLIKDILTGYGYNVIEADDGESSVDQFMKNKMHIDLAIVDVIMPKKNGKVVYAEMQLERPDMKVIFISGYTADIIHQKGIFEEGIQFLAKPITADQLLKKVRDVLDG